MPQKKFKVGDLVELTSGGPLMTVEGFITSMHDFNNVYEIQELAEFALCSWFNGKTKETKGFAIDALELSKKPEPISPPTIRRGVQLP